MYFGLSEEQESIQDFVKKFLADNSTVDEIRKIANGEGEELEKNIFEKQFRNRDRQPFSYRDRQPFSCCIRQIVKKSEVCPSSTTQFCERCPAIPLRRTVVGSPSGSSRKTRNHLFS